VWRARTHHHARTLCVLSARRARSFRWLVPQAPPKIKERRNKKKNSQAGMCSQPARDGGVLFVVCFVHFFSPPHACMRTHTHARARTPRYGVHRADQRTEESEARDGGVGAGKPKKKKRTNKSPRNHAPWHDGAAAAVRHGARGGGEGGSKTTRIDAHLCLGP